MWQPWTTWEQCEGHIRLTAPCAWIEWEVISIWLIKDVAACGVTCTSIVNFEVSDEYPYISLCTHGRPTDCIYDVELLDFTIRGKGKGF
ncbi:hypothetical protein VFPPC_15298 [Pochonia chlamydosporia 170]|uniref:Uncharacterized protein n=1 Tax=Pochonia chlamydosporia 170 TaxID=1380566 RepID=A0A179G781_METCM|nr:hypothetical protein VFPPC_15298 [Pochonia chlamydosporia 170]OAQ73398.1 hypothetical protein VFPPC_15298 [Pochonia chlamydosporia 170]